MALCLTSLSSITSPIPITLRNLTTLRFQSHSFLAPILILTKVEFTDMIPKRQQKKESMASPTKFCLLLEMKSYLLLHLLSRVSNGLGNSKIMVLKELTPSSLLSSVLFIIKGELSMMKSMRMSPIVSKMLNILDWIVIALLVPRQAEKNAIMPLDLRIKNSLTFWQMLLIITSKTPTTKILEDIS